MNYLSCGPHKTGCKRVEKEFMNDLGLITHLRRLANDFANDPSIDHRIRDAINNLEARLADQRPFYLHPDERHDCQLLLDYLAIKIQSRKVLRPATYDFAKPFTDKTARGNVEYVESIPSVKYEKGKKQRKP